MKVSTILDHIDSGHIALPEFQRGYVWNRDQVRALMDSLYRRHPVGGLLVWVTQSDDAPYRGGGDLAPGVVKLLLDGQQRISTLYGIIRGEPPEFFDGNSQAFDGLRFHLGQQEFSFYQPIKMKDDPLWIDVTSLMKDGIGRFLPVVSEEAGSQDEITEYFNRLNAVHSVQTIEFHVDEVTGDDKTVDIVVDIFNRVNSGGTKLSKGDLCLAKICAEWPDGRQRMKAILDRWSSAGYNFDLDWLLRNVNTVITGEALFAALSKVASGEIQEGLARTEKVIDYLLNLVSGRLGLDHDRVLFGKYAFPVMAHYIARLGGTIGDSLDRDRLLFWYLHSALWGRFSGSTESVINRDLEHLSDTEGGLDRLIDALRLERGDLRVQPGHFSGWSLGARFYPMLYLLTRMGDARDWGTGLPLKSGLLGKQNRLEVHHIFPKAILYRHGYGRAQVNAVANFCFLTQNTNLAISARAPEVYLEEVAEHHPGALESQWIPMNRDLWRVENYNEFLEARKVLLASAANELLNSLFGGELVAEAEEEPSGALAGGNEPDMSVLGGAETEEEEDRILKFNDWVAEQGLPDGELFFEVADPDTGEALAVLDIAWSNGLQEGLSEPAALILNEPREVLVAANQAGFRCFETETAFRDYIEKEILALEAAG